MRAIGPDTRLWYVRMYNVHLNIGVGKNLQPADLKLSTILWSASTNAMRDAYDLIGVRARLGACITTFYMTCVCCNTHVHCTHINLHVCICNQCFYQCVCLFLLGEL